MTKKEIIGSIILVLSFTLNVYFFQQGEYLVRTSPLHKDYSTFKKLSGLDAESIIWVDIVKPVLGSSSHIAMGGIVSDGSGASLGENIRQFEWENTPDFSASLTGVTFQQLVEFSSSLYKLDSNGLESYLTFTPYGEDASLVFVAVVYD